MVSLTTVDNIRETTEDDVKTHLRDYMQEVRTKLTRHAQ